MSEFKANLKAVIYSPPLLKTGVGEGCNQEGILFSLLPDKGKEAQGSQYTIEWDICDEVAHVITEGPEQVLGREGGDYTLQTKCLLTPGLSPTDCRDTSSPPPSKGPLE